VEEKANLFTFEKDEKSFSLKIRNLVSNFLKRYTVPVREEIPSRRIKYL